MPAGRGNRVTVPTRQLVFDFRLKLRFLKLGGCDPRDNRGDNEKVCDPYSKLLYIPI
jgi:hypothetical protein